ncbi:glyceraldehyde-3-phosphate dehydrogenase [Vannielia sp.]|nr:glyceraldehyde-3-phosphate dehydrogenase [Vannielia sp.]MDF1871543.1 glyceraldehyde-3-phosphate dehydrogenase [Vannielia sp.]
MTNRLAIVLFILFIALLVGDGVLNDGSGTMIALKRFAQLTEWLAFWR